jgi:C4-dicarboxylate-specific signal transduction histidine kinase
MKDAGGKVVLWVGATTDIHDKRVAEERVHEAERRHAEELEQRVAERTRELQEALSNVKQLEGLLPICAWCKKVRDSTDYWHEVEHYVAAHTEVRFSHGMCPKCFEKAVEELDQGL